MGNTKYLYVITHCESCYNKQRIFTGRLDSVLTANGREHAKRLDEKLKNEDIDVIYVSPLKRTKQTAKYILKHHPKAKVITDKRIIERDYGDMSGKSKEKYKKDHPKLYPIYHRSYDVPPPGGESIKEVEKRIVPFIEQVLVKMKREKINVLIVAHSNSVRPIRKHFENLTNGQMMKLEHMRHKIFKYEVAV